MCLLNIIIIYLLNIKSNSNHIFSFKYILQQHKKNMAVSQGSSNKRYDQNY